MPELFADFVLTVHIHPHTIGPPKNPAARIPIVRRCRRARAIAMRGIVSAATATWASTSACSRRSGHVDTTRGRIHEPNP